MRPTIVLFYICCLMSPTSFVRDFIGGRVTTKSRTWRPRRSPSNSLVRPWCAASDDKKSRDERMSSEREGVWHRLSVLRTVNPHALCSSSSSVPLILSFFFFIIFFFCFGCVVKPSRRLPTAILPLLWLRTPGNQVSHPSSTTDYIIHSSILCNITQHCWLDWSQNQATWVRFWNKRFIF